jgi:hypothetical protein
MDSWYKFGRILFLLFVVWIVICGAISSPNPDCTQIIYQLVEPKPSATQLTGTRTAMGKVLWIKFNQICIEHPTEGRLMAFFDSKTSIVYQNHRTHERKVLKVSEVSDWLKSHPIDNAVIGMHKNKVSDLLLILVCEDFKEEEVEIEDK